MSMNYLTSSWYDIKLFDCENRIRVLTHILNTI